MRDCVLRQGGPPTNGKGVGMRLAGEPHRGHHRQNHSTTPFRCQGVPPDPLINFNPASRTTPPCRDTQRRRSESNSLEAALQAAVWLQRLEYTQQSVVELRLEDSTKHDKPE